MAETLCEICRLPLDSKQANSETCPTCLRVLRCLEFIKSHSLCSCGDAYCVHNTKERKTRAEKLARIKTEIATAV